MRKGELMKIILFLLLMIGISFAREEDHPDKFGHPYKSQELIEYKTSWGSGGVTCDVTDYGRVYTCVIVKPCAPKGNNPCGCGEDVCQ